ncbi:MAG: glycosyl hydrolase family 43 [Lentisphaerae bacterium]|nr:glycosyl hydrolase family 43 [Lentisphaerota bacterium]MBT4822602.1 glycosyl hydrolase family 43 [Lentisphaerota bacterium]MBT5607774.1 glycosyl hydrolase family 43 [Lentisphaerota bacterium]MBT7054546.1 glycosyl hydrolase family 43 [Lentisphaerota bacterium]MBT7846408.1 glycosyl hydrolase family 43 [Lentisphaerota bacterium]
MIERILPSPVNGGFRMENYWVWCGSAIRGEDGRFHLFAARWPKHLPFFEGYQVYSEVVRASSDTPEGPYQFEEVVLPDRGAEFWDGRMTHNPTIHRCGDKYVLFYIGATFEGEKPTAEELADGATAVTRASYSSIRIGMAVADSVRGPWARPDAPCLRTRPGKWDGSVVTNPAPCVLDDGRILMYYRANTPNGLRIGATMAEELGAPFERISDDPVLQFEGDDFVEDPYVWQVDGHFELVAKDIKGGICGEVHAGIHARSDDGVHWELCDPPKAYSRRILWDDGSTTAQGCVERPQLLIEDGVPTHIFAATGDGPGGFRSCENTWNMVIPLRREG